LSNPTSRSEATPSDLLDWTEGRAVIGTGSPFPPVVKNGVQRRIDQTNNSYVFPGIGLGAISVWARRISDGMLLAAARALAEASPSKRDSNANLLPRSPSCATFPIAWRSHWRFRFKARALPKRQAGRNSKPSFA
jgi:malate dehydrogenase (oxaloacetate-decarboxylating)